MLTLYLDGLSRQTNAVYTGDSNYSTSYAYDKMGNITALQRYDVLLVDNLTLNYNGNQLTKVEDASNNTFGFKNGINATTEYYYDGNGNLTKDNNKGITNISYNSLSLPSVVTFGDGSIITYTYAADGRKLRTVHVIDGDTTTTDYCGNVIYENGIQKRLLTEVGYVDLSDNSYHFFIKDHLGNNRIVADSNGNIEESNQYYPFGLSYANSSANLQPYKYNGKELDTKNGLNWYDYGARHYDVTLGRWHVVDPLSEKYYSTSPYTYCSNNPIRYIDPNGLAWRPTYDEDREGNRTYNGYLWVPEEESYDENGILKKGLYAQAIFFSDNGTFNEKSRFNIGSSTAFVYKLDGTIEKFDANTRPSSQDYAMIPEGIYHAVVGTHRGQYPALRMSDINDSKQIELGQSNPAHPELTYAVGINIHKPGYGNVTGMTSNGKPISEGCLLIDRNKWNEFIQIFNTPSQLSNKISVTVSRNMNMPINMNRFRLP